jgi:hypothetical protein
VLPHLNKQEEGLKAQLERGLLIKISARLDLVNAMRANWTIEFVPADRIRSRRSNSFPPIEFVPADRGRADEISMLDAAFMNKLDFVVRRLRMPIGQRPFGGIQLVITGDFFQLPLVGKKVSSPGGEDGRPFVAPDERPPVKLAFQAEC